jgi:hypothetical protein
MPINAASTAGNLVSSFSAPIALRPRLVNATCGDRHGAAVPRGVARPRPPAHASASAAIFALYCETRLCSGLKAAPG